MKLTIISFLIISFNAFGNYVADQISGAPSLGLMCQTDNFDTFTNGVAVRVDLPVVETGVNTFKFVEASNARALFTFQFRKNYSNQIETASFDNVRYLTSVLSYKLSGFRTFDSYGDLEKIYEVYSFDESIEAFRDARGEDYTFTITPSYDGQKMMLDGEGFQQYAGAYNVNCFIGTRQN